MDNLRDVVDDVLHTQEDLQEEQRNLQERQHDLQEGQRNLQGGHRNLQEGQRDLQEGQRNLQEMQRDLRDLQEGQRNLQEMQRDLRDLQEGQRNLQERQRDIHEMQRLYDEQKMEQDLLNDILANLQDALGKVLHESVRRQDRRIESHELTPALRSAMADIEGYVKQQESSSYDGQLLWKISDYARRRNDAVTGKQVSFYSPCFYTSRYGYKMRARIFLNGDSMGRGTHISLFFVVMCGQYDALLRWPFRQKVTFMLLDQDNVEHVIDAFRPDPSSSSFQRPRREANIASGCPMFCSLAGLNNHAYVRDDTIFVKIIVDTSDL